MIKICGGGVKAGKLLFFSGVALQNANQMA